MSSCPHGSLRIVGLGPGPLDWLTPEAETILAEASDLIGYKPYLDRITPKPGQTLHASDNRVEIERARLALQLAAEGKSVAVVSGGDPGIFAMAAAVFEAIEQGEPTWADLDIHVAPGVSAMQAAAAKVGAPLGHDFCAISLSDNLKPWSLVERRLKAACEGDFVIALYNPASKARPEAIYKAFTLLRTHKPAQTPIVFARAVGRPDERIIITTLAEAEPGCADMSTLVLIGSSTTRLIARTQTQPRLYAARHGCHLMSIDQIQNIGRCMHNHGRRGLRLRPFDHDHRQTEAARRENLAIGRRPAAVLGDETINPFRYEQGGLAFGVEGPTILDDMIIGQGQILHRFNGADQIEMLRRHDKSLDLQAPDGEEDAARNGSQNLRGGLHIRDGNPVIALLFPPGRAGQGNELDPCFPRRHTRMVGHDRREWMRRIDQHVDLVVTQKSHKPRNATEAPDAKGNGRRHRRAGPPGQGEQAGKIRPPREHFGQGAGLAGATKEKDLLHRAPFFPLWPS